MNTKSKNDKKTRITVDLSQPFYERLERLGQIVGADSKADLIRESLRLYEYVAKKTVEGCTFRVVDRKGHQQDIVFLGAVSPDSVETSDEEAVCV